MTSEVEHLYAKATARPWRTTGVMLGHVGDIFVPTAKRIPDCHHIARCFAPKPEKSPACSLQAIQMTNEAVAQIEANAALIVHAVNNIERLEAHTTSLSQRLEAAVSALEPFAEACTISNKDDDCDLDDSIAATKITFGDLRRARAALATLRADEGEG